MNWLKILVAIGYVVGGLIGMAVLAVLVVLIMFGIWLLQEKLREKSK
jgi:hypothetical protein